MAALSSGGLNKAHDPLLHQYTAVAIEGRALLLAGPPGSGKSSLALSLIDRGAMLIGDDGIVLTADGGALIATPPPATLGLLEIRNVGIVQMPCISAPVALVIHIDADAPRYIERALAVVIECLQIPCLSMHLAGHAAPVRAEHALRLYGIGLGLAPDGCKTGDKTGDGGFSKTPVARRGEV